MPDYIDPCFSGMNQILKETDTHKVDCVVKSQVMLGQTYFTEDNNSNKETTGYKNDMYSQYT